MSTMSRGSHLIFFAGGGPEPSSQFVDELAADEAAVKEFEAVDESVPLPVAFVDDDLPEPPPAVLLNDDTVDANIPVVDDKEFDDELLVLPLLLADDDVVTDAPDVDTLADADVAEEAEDGGGC